MSETLAFADVRADEPASEARPILASSACGLCLALTLLYDFSPHLPAGALRSFGTAAVRSLPQIWDGSYAALFTAAFIHGNPSSPLSTILHLGFNALYLFALGGLLEATIRRTHWVLFFVGSAIVSSGAEIALSGKVGVGVSGVVYAMFGMMWAGRGKYPQWRAVATRANAVVLIAWSLFCVLATWLNWLHVANAAHLGGLLFGLSVGWIATRRRRVVAWSTLGALAALTVLSVTWMPWSLPWTEWRASRELTHGSYTAAAYWYEHSLRLGADPRDAWRRLLLVATLAHDSRGIQTATDRLERLGEVVYRSTGYYRFVAPQAGTRPSSQPPPHMPYGQVWSRALEKAGTSRPSKQP